MKKVRIIIVAVLVGFALPLVAQSSQGLWPISGQRYNHTQVELGTATTWSSMPTFSSGVGSTMNTSTTLSSLSTGQFVSADEYLNPATPPAPAVRRNNGSYDWAFPDITDESTQVPLSDGTWILLGLAALYAAWLLRRRTAQP